MSPLAHDVRHKQADAQKMPSVTAWVAAGNKVERIESPPAPPLRLLPVFYRPRTQVQP